MTSSNPAAGGADGLADFVAQLLAATGALMSIVEHMQRWISSGRSAPDAPPVPEVLSKLLRGVLAPLAERRGEDVMEATSAVLAEAAEIICSELFLVPIEESENGQLG